MNIKQKKQVGRITNAEVQGNGILRLVVDVLASEKGCELTVDDLIILNKIN